jgi:hypothetical protein
VIRTICTVRRAKLVADVAHQIETGAVAFHDHVEQDQGDVRMGSQRQFRFLRRERIE